MGFKNNFWEQMEQMLIKLGIPTDRKIGSDEMVEKNMQNVKRSVKRIMDHKNYNEDIQAVLDKLNEEIDDYKYMNGI